MLSKRHSISIAPQYQPTAGNKGTPLVGKHLNSSMDLSGHHDLRSSSMVGAIKAAGAGAPRPASSSSGTSGAHRAPALPAPSSGATRDVTQVRAPHCIQSAWEQPQSHSITSHTHDVNRCNRWDLRYEAHCTSGVVLHDHVLSRYMYFIVQHVQLAVLPAGACVHLL